jgi:hypothetical protein
MENKTTPSPAVAPIVRSDNDRQQSPRERSAYVGGAKLKLKVFGDIPGYKMFWENDQDAAIEQLLEYGFEFVNKTEVGMRSTLVADDGVDGRISKHVGTKQDGSPLRAFLMKATLEIWAEIDAANQEQADTWEEGIRRGAGTGIEDRNRYIPRGFEPKVTSGIRGQR